METDKTYLILKYGSIDKAHQVWIDYNNTDAFTPSQNKLLNEYSNGWYSHLNFINLNIKP